MMKRRTSEIERLFVLVADEHGHLKIYLPKKLLECLPKCTSLPKERHRWNTNEVRTQTFTAGCVIPHRGTGKTRAASPLMVVSKVIEEVMSLPVTFIESVSFIAKNEGTDSFLWEF